jgi:hypothetical protein
MSSEPTDADYELAARHSDAEQRVSVLLYQMRLVRFECEQRLAPLAAQLQVARHVLASLTPQYQAMMDRLEEERV